jgi:DNA-binding NtrC family response regulator
MKRSILIVEDDARLRASLARVLEDGRTDVRAADSAEAALQLLGQRRPALVISDVRMPGMTGLELLRLLKARAPEVDVILMTAYDDLPTAAGAMRDGAADFLVKPLDLHRVRAVVERVLADRNDRVAPGTGRDSGAGRDVAAASDPDAPASSGAPPSSGARSSGALATGPDLVGHSPPMVEIFKLIGQLSDSRATVVIRGESGTGKELVARAIHRSSPASAEPFVAVNCTSLPATLLESELFGHVKGSFTGATADRRGRFALAGRGTIFLDEIGDTTPDFQAKLLRVLQEREYYPVGAERPERTEARVLAATHRDLEAMVEAETFRRDLYYRLGVVELRVPPLRDRPADIPVLAEHLVSRASRAAGRRPPTLSPEALEALVAHAWPGNVRELENCLVRAVLLSTGDVLRPHHLALDGAGRAGAQAGVPRLVPLEDVVAEHVAQVLSGVGGNRTRAAEVLGISRPRLRRIIDKHGL